MIVLSQWLWLLLIAYWIFSSRKIKSTAVKENRRKRLQHLVLIIFGFALIMEEDYLPSLLQQRSAFGGLEYFGALLTVVGIAFAIWARFTLGTNWSGAVTLKDEHRLIQSGPYRWVRHPIYTGILVGALGSAIVVNSLGATLGVLVIVVAYLVKIQKEEALLQTHFRDQYAAYRDVTKKVIPFIY